MREFKVARYTSYNSVGRFITVRAKDREGAVVEYCLNYAEVNVANYPLKVGVMDGFQFEGFVVERNEQDGLTVKSKVRGK